MDLLNLASGVLLGLGLFFALTGSLGVLRMPDFYSRIHPAGKSETLAQVLIIAGLALQAESAHVVVKLALLSTLLFLTSPTATYAIAKAARLDGLVPWIQPGDEDALASRELQLTPAVVAKEGDPLAPEHGDGSADGHGRKGGSDE